MQIISTPMAPPLHSNVFLTETDLAMRWQISVKTLQNARVAGSSVAYVKIGRLVRYRLSDIEMFEHAGERNMLGGRR